MASDRPRDTFCAQVSAASGGIDFDRSVKTLAPGYDFNLSLDPGCAETDMYGCSRVPPGSGQAALLYSGKRVCRPPGGRGGAGEGYMGASDGALSPGGSIWLTSRPVLEVLVRGAGLYEI